VTRLFWVLVAASVVLVWLLPVIPGHDLPQHLAYARILADRNDEVLARLYEIDVSDGYATLHRALAWLANVTTLDCAIRIVYTAHALCVPLAFRSLVRAVNGRPRPALELFGVVLVWNPVACMGFLPFMIALAPAVFGASAAVRFASRGRALDAFWLLAATLVLGAIHVVAMGALLAFVGIHALARRGRAFVALGICCAAAAVIVLQPRPSTSLDGSLAWAALDARWTPPREKLNMVLATAFGPFPRRTRLLIEICAVIFAGELFLARARSAIAGRETIAFRWAAFGFAAFALSVPHSVRKPDDLSYLDFRLFVFALAFALAAIPARYFARRRAALATGAAITLFVVCWTRNLALASREVEGGVQLAERTGKSDRLLALSFHDRSAWFDESNGMNHYVGVYHTARTGGVTSLFWAKFARHLPVGYRPGVEPPRPPDWRPSDFTEEQIHHATHVLVTWPDASDSKRQRAGADRLRAMDELREIECRGRYCLYSVAQTEAME
jgi:hypothetical protein